MTNETSSLKTKYTPFMATLLTERTHELYSNSRAGDVLGNY